MEEFRVQLFRNAADSQPVAFQVKKSWDMATFRKKAGQKLGFGVKRVFLASGSELTGVDEMQANEQLFQIGRAHV